MWLSRPVCSDGFRHGQTERSCLKMKNNWPRAAFVILGSITRPLRKQDYFSELIGRYFYRSCFKQKLTYFKVILLQVSVSWFNSHNAFMTVLIQEIHKNIYIFFKCIVFSKQTKLCKCIKTLKIHIILFSTDFSTIIF